MPKSRLPSSFRDPSGFLFEKDEELFRQINEGYKDSFELLNRSGLYKSLVEEESLIPHREVNKNEAFNSDAYKVIQPEKVPFVSYPYEWSFSQLKDAALKTLEIQKTALEYDMILKDATAFNIQFLKGKPILIDTLSFDTFDEKPWVAYKQFCQHFLAPLALAAYVDINLMKLTEIFIDGVPLDLTSKLLPMRTKIKPSLLIHLHLHASSQKRYADKGIKKQEARTKFSKRSMLGIIDSLEGAIKGLKWKPRNTEWADYYEGKLNYLPASLRNKANLVEEFLTVAKPQNVWDLGANTGLFSRIAADKGIFTVSSDIDPAAVEMNFKTVKEKGEKNILPLWIDLTNPSPNLGWQNKERDSFLERGPADTILALALVHHLAISNNLPFEKLAPFFRKLCKSLIIEFVPKEDSQVQKLLASREDIFPDYKKEKFEEEFRNYFTIKKTAAIKDSKRTLYLMLNK
ncbi:MAG: SAM-dependent methyltransferase [Candidatus Woykebacteria bacterium]